MMIEIDINNNCMYMCTDIWRALKCIIFSFKISIQYDDWMNTEYDNISPSLCTLDTNNGCAMDI